MKKIKFHTKEKQEADDIPQKLLLTQMIKFFSQMHQPIW